MLFTKEGTNVSKHLFCIPNAWQEKVTFSKTPNGHGKTWALLLVLTLRGNPPKRRVKGTNGCLDSGFPGLQHGPKMKSTRSDAIDSLSASRKLSIRFLLLRAAPALVYQQVSTRPCCRKVCFVRVAELEIGIRKTEKKDGMCFFRRTYTARSISSPCAGSWARGKNKFAKWFWERCGLALLADPSNWWVETLVRQSLDSRAEGNNFPHKHTNANAHTHTHTERCR